MCEFKRVLAGIEQKLTLLIFVILRCWQTAQTKEFFVIGGRLACSMTCTGKSRPSFDSSLSALTATLKALEYIPATLLRLFNILNFF